MRSAENYSLLVTSANDWEKLYYHKLELWILLHQAHFIWHNPAWIGIGSFVKTCGNP